jgi:hypothetical protein
VIGYLRATELTTEHKRSRVCWNDSGISMSRSKEEDADFKDTGAPVTLARDARRSTRCSKRPACRVWTCPAPSEPTQVATWTAFICSRAIDYLRGVDGDLIFVSAR